MARHDAGLLKAFLEQVMRPGVALEYRKHGFPRGLLAGRSGRLVVTMGVPAVIYRAHGMECAGSNGASSDLPAWPLCEVAEIFRRRGPAWRASHAGHVSLGQLKVMSASDHLWRSPLFYVSKPPLLGSEIGPRLPCYGKSLRTDGLFLALYT